MSLQRHPLPVKKDPEGCDDFASFYARSLGGRRFDASLMEAMQTAWRRLRYRRTPGRWQRP